MMSCLVIFFISAFLFSWFLLMDVKGVLMVMFYFYFFLLYNLLHVFLALSHGAE